MAHGVLARLRQGGGGGERETGKQKERDAEGERKEREGGGALRARRGGEGDRGKEECSQEERSTAVKAKYQVRVVPGSTFALPPSPLLPLFYPPSGVTCSLRQTALRPGGWSDLRKVTVGLLRVLVHVQGQVPESWLWRRVSCSPHYSAECCMFCGVVRSLHPYAFLSLAASLLLCLPASGSLPAS
eukprot:2589005-Rhodomonas_salina.1